MAEGDKPNGQGLRPDARQRAKSQSVCASLRMAAEVESYGELTNGRVYNNL